MDGLNYRQLFKPAITLKCDKQLNMVNNWDLIKQMLINYIPVFFTDNNADTIHRLMFNVYFKSLDLQSLTTSKYSFW